VGALRFGGLAAWCGINRELPRAVHVAQLSRGEGLSFGDLGLIAEPAAVPAW